MQNRYKLAVSLVRHKFRKVLDLGCGGRGRLKEYLPKDIYYQGIDFKKGERIMAHNLEKGIPFGNKSFDVVFALDVLEHLENIHFVFKEMLRVAKNEIVIALPNMFHWTHRLRYIRGKTSLVKYTFYTEKHLDRHRWLPSYDSSVEFVKFNAGGYKVKLGFGIYPYQRFKFLGKTDEFFSRFFPNLFVYTAFFHINLTNKEV